MTEQPGLFDIPEQKAEKPPEPVKKIESRPPMPFLPGVKYDESFPEIIDFEMLREKAAGCNWCGLRENCQQVVFGSGNTRSRIMFIGEGPGKDEDIQGIPFVGRAGQLLDKILAAADFERQDVYIANVVKCRPPENRLPRPDEVQKCRNYLEAQIRIIQPKIIVCLGSLATQTVIDPKARITQVRGKWFNRQDIMIMGTFHPAALLRNQNYKRPVWEDFKLIRQAFVSLNKE